MDYQNKIWGGSQVRLKLNYLAYLRLKYALDAIANLKSKSKVLEIGCGGGGFIASIKNYRADLNCFGIDIGNKAIKYAGKKFKSVTYKVGDIYNINFPKNSFDAVIIEDVLEHLEDPNLAVKEISRVLKPNGIFHAYVPLEGETFTLHNLFNKLGIKFKEKFAGHIQNYKYKDIKKILLKNKFKINKNVFEVFLLGQIIDLSFFTILSIFNKRPEGGLEQEIDGNKLLKLLKNLITTIVNLESIIVSKTDMPGAGVHLSAINKK